MESLFLKVLLVLNIILKTQKIFSKKNINPMRFKKMNFGYKLILIGLIIAGFIYSYEYPNMTSGGIEEISAIGSLVTILIGALFLFKSK